MQQRDLFARMDLPPGMQYRSDFISPDEEAGLLANIAQLPLSEAKYRQFNARRRIVSFGGSYDFSKRQLLPADEMPEFLHPFRERVANWVGVSAAEFGHALI